jgi:hypothetical protein
MPTSDCDADVAESEQTGISLIAPADPTYRSQMVAPDGVTVPPSRVSRLLGPRPQVL